MYAANASTVELSPISWTVERTVLPEWWRYNGRFYQNGRFQNGRTDGSTRMVAVERSVLLEQSVPER